MGECDEKWANGGKSDEGDDKNDSEEGEGRHKAERSGRKAELEEAIDIN